MVDIHLRPLRIGEEKEERGTAAAKYNGLPITTYGKEDRNRSRKIQWPALLALLYGQGLKWF